MNPNLAAQLELLPLYLSRHLQVALLALIIGAALSLPLGILIHRIRALQAPVLGLVGVIQTIPGLALLALMVPLLGQIGFLPALIALTLYSMLPVVANTVAGLAGVAPELTEAARGIGMTGRQMLWQVELPLAAPTILAGLRTAAVWTIGIATLATPVGWTSLGNFIFAGLQTQNTTAVLVGCIAAAGLALALDLLIRLLERAARVRSIATGIGALALLLAFVAAGLYPLWGRSAASAVPVASGTESRGRVLIGTKTFTEQYILADVLALHLRARGYQPEVLSSLGSSVVFDALKSGRVNVYVDYSGTIWANYLGREDMPSGDEMLAQITAELGAQGLDVIPLGFENAYALAMRGEQARELGITSVSDLAEHSARLKVGSDYEFFQRPEWASVRDAYGLSFARQVTLDPSLMYEAAAQGSVDVISAYTTDGRIVAYDLAVLDDPRGALPPYDAVLLVRRDAAGLAADLEALRNAIPDAAMREANKLVDVDKQSVPDAAAWLSETLP